MKIFIKNEKSAAAYLMRRRSRNNIKSLKSKSYVQGNNMVGLILMGFASI